MIVFVSLILFPRLALGLSGFETGVAVMPLVKGDKDLSEERLEKHSFHARRSYRGRSSGQQLLRGRNQNTKKLLRTAALIMSVMLITSSIVTTTLIPPRRLPKAARLTDVQLRISPITSSARFSELFTTSARSLILWFAGASAMAGLLSIVPRYLPRYGMAPDWARAARPLVLVIR